MLLAVCHVHATQLVLSITSVIARLASAPAKMCPLLAKAVTNVKTITLDLILRLEGKSL
jgi:hypothetical protein